MKKLPALILFSILLFSFLLIFFPKISYQKRLVFAQTCQKLIIDITPKVVPVGSQYTLRVTFEDGRPYTGFLDSHSWRCQIGTLDCVEREGAWQDIDQNDIWVQDGQVVIPIDSRYSLGTYRAQFRPRGCEVPWSNWTVVFIDHPEISCPSNLLCPPGKKCAIDEISDQAGCGSPVTTQFPRFPEGAYAIFRDEPNGKFQGWTRLEIEMGECELGGPTMRFTKSDKAAYWNGGGDSNLRWCVSFGTQVPGVIRAEGGTVHHNNLRKEGSLKYVSYDDNTGGYLGSVNLETKRLDDYGDDSQGLYYTLVPAPQSVAVLPDNRWTRWISRVGGYASHLIEDLFDSWHVELRDPEFGGDLLVRYVEWGTADHGKWQAWSVTEDWEWDTDGLLTKIRQWFNVDLDCWHGKYRCDTTGFLKNDLNLVDLYMPSSEPFKIRFVDSLKTDFDQGATELTIRPNESYRLKILTHDNKPYHGFLRVRTDLASEGGVWITKGNYPIYVHNGYVEILPSAWSGLEGRTIQFQSKQQVATSEMSVIKSLSPQNQPNREGQQWSETLTLTILPPDVSVFGRISNAVSNTAAGVGNVASSGLGFVSNFGRTIIRPWWEFRKATIREFLSKIQLTSGEWWLSLWRRFINWLNVLKYFRDGMVKKDIREIANGLELSFVSSGLVYPISPEQITIDKLVDNTFEQNVCRTELKFCPQAHQGRTQVKYKNFQYISSERGDQAAIWIDLERGGYWVYATACGHALKTTLEPDSANVLECDSFKFPPPPTPTVALTPTPEPTIIPSPTTALSPTPTPTLSPPPPPLCTITNASWSQDSALEGDGIQLIVEGENCGGQTVNLKYWEEDKPQGLLGKALSTVQSFYKTLTGKPILGEPPKNDPLDPSEYNLPKSITFTQEAGSEPWQTVWFEDIDGPDPDPKIFFEARLGESTTRSNVLTMSKPSCHNDDGVCPERCTPENDNDCLIIFRDNFETDLSSWQIMQQNPPNEIKIEDCVDKDGRCLTLAYQEGKDDYLWLKGTFDSSTNILVRVFFYDDLDESLGTMVEVKNRDETAGTALGIMTNCPACSPKIPPDSNHYAIRINSLSGTISTGVARTRGWHMFEIIVTDRGTYAKIDNKLVKTKAGGGRYITVVNPKQTDTSSLHFVSSWGLWDTFGKVYYDDVLVVKADQKPWKDQLWSPLESFYQLYQDIDFSALYTRLGVDGNDLRSLLNTAFAFYLYGKHTNNAAAVNRGKKLFLDSLNYGDWENWSGHKEWARGIIGESFLLTGFLMWEELTPQERARFQKIVFSQADAYFGPDCQFLAPCQEVKFSCYPQSCHEDNTKAEENAWNAMFLSAAANLFPFHQNAPLWEKRARCFAYHAITTSTDSPYCEIETQTVYDDFTLENHGQDPDIIEPNPVYSASTIGHLTTGALSYKMTGKETPEELKHNVLNLFDRFDDFIDPNAYQYTTSPVWSGSIDSLYHAVLALSYVNDMEVSLDISWQDFIQKRSLFYYGIPADFHRPFNESPRAISGFTCTPIEHESCVWFLNSVSAAEVYGFTILYRGGYVLPPIPLFCQNDDGVCPEGCTLKNDNDC